MASGAHPRPVDRPIVVCDRWLKMNAEIQALTLRWAEVESSLARDFNWLRLTEKDQEKVIQGRELRDIDARLGKLFKQRERLSTVVLRLSATSYDAVVAKLAVLAALVDPEDHPAAHTLVTSTVDELKALNLNYQSHEVRTDGREIATSQRSDILDV